MSFFNQYANGVMTALGFFWNALWAFVMGYAISAAIQVFVPKSRLTRHMGDCDIKSISLAGVFGAIAEALVGPLSDPLAKTQLAESLTQFCLRAVGAPPAQAQAIQQQQTA